MTADIFDSLSSFFDSPIWSVLKVLLVVFIVLMWLALGIWVYRDAGRRNAAPGYPRLMAAIGLLIPYFGPLLYMAVRPAETISEQRDRQLEQQLAAIRHVMVRQAACAPLVAVAMEPPRDRAHECHRSSRGQIDGQRAPPDRREQIDRVLVR